METDSQASKPTPHVNSQSNGQQPTAEMYEFNFLQLLNYFYSYRLWIALGTLVCMLFASTFLIIVRKPTYRSSVTINIDLTAEDRGVSAMPSFSFIQDQIVQNKISIVEQYFESSEFKDFIFEYFMGTKLPKNLVPERDLILAELERLEITEQSEIQEWLLTGFDLRGAAEKFRLTLSASAARPALAAALTNIGSHALVEFNRRMLVQRLRNLGTFLKGQTTQTKADLKALEGQLVALQKSARIFSPEEVRAKANALLVDQEAKLIELNRQHAALSALITETEADLTYFKGMVQANGSVSHLYIEQMLRRLEVLKYQQAQGDSAGGPGSSDRAQQIIGDLAKQLENKGPVSASPWDYVKKIENALFDLKQKRLQAKSELRAQEEAVEQTNREFSGLPDALKRLSEVKRSIDLSTALYTTLMTRLQETQIKEAAHTNDLVIVTLAELPTAPSGLGRTRTLMLSIVGGLILSILPLFLRFVLLPTIRNVKDLAHLGVPIVGEVPWFQSNAFSFIASRFHPKSSRLLVESPTSSEANALRFVRFKLDQALGLKNANPEQLGRVLQISSVNNGEGRTFLSANLADLFSASGVKTCLVELDFSTQKLMNYFPEATTEGSTLVRNFPRECGFALKRVHPNLFVLKADPTRAEMSEILETNAFHAALNSLRMRYDLLILDTPPLTGYMEPVVSAQYADALLLVINQRGTLRTEVEAAIRMIQSSLSLPIFGVMNFAFDDVFRPRFRGSKLKVVADKKEKKGPKTPPQTPPTSSGPKGGPSGSPGSGPGPVTGPTTGPSQVAVNSAPPAKAEPTPEVAAVATQVAQVSEQSDRRNRFASLGSSSPAGSAKSTVSLSDLINAPDPDDLKDEPSEKPTDKTIDKKKIS